MLLTDKYTIQRHLDTFGRMAAELTPYVGRCIFSFVEMYKKPKVNMPEPRPVSEVDKHTLAEGLGRIANENGLWLQTCATKENYEPFGIHTNGCMTTEIFSKTLGLEFGIQAHIRLVIEDEVVLDLGPLRQICIVIIVQRVTIRRSGAKPRVMTLK